jgi:hypothetical protein
VQKVIDTDIRRFEDSSWIKPAPDIPIRASVIKIRNVPISYEHNTTPWPESANEP